MDMPFVYLVLCIYVHKLWKNHIYFETNKKNRFYFSFLNITYESLYMNVCTSI